MIDAQETTAAATQAVDRSELETMKRMLAAEQRRRIEVEAMAFVERAITASQVLPAARAALTDLYTQAALDDIVTPLAEPTSGGRVALVVAAIASQPAHRLTEERIPAGQDARVLLNNTGGPSDYADERASATAYALRANGKK